MWPPSDTVEECNPPPVPQHRLVMHNVFPPAAQLVQRNAGQIPVDNEQQVGNQADGNEAGEGGEMGGNGAGDEEDDEDLVVEADEDGAVVFLRSLTNRYGSYSGI